MNIEEIKEGMYVRTIHGIGKITKIFYESENGEDLCLDNYISVEDDYGNNKYSNYIYFDEREELMFKYSKNIIDLIEVGDYVNGYKIDYINLNCETPFLRSNQPYRVDNTLYSTLIEKGKNYNQPLHFYEEDIKTILTKEQYENNVYRIGE